MDRSREEWVDIVDRDDAVVRTVPRRVMRRERLLHRAVYIAVVHPDGRLLIHRRSAPVEIGGGVYEDDQLAVLGRCYRVVTEQPFTFTDGEVVEAEWVELRQVRELRSRRRFLPDSLALIGPLLGLG